MEKIRCYYLTEHGELLHPDIIGIALQSLEEFGELEDLGFGSAYNMPAYLLGEIEKAPESTFVIAWDFDTYDGMPYPRTLAGEEEILPLIEALEANLDGNSWEIAIAVHKRIRPSKNE